uniref:Leucine Rich repeats (2 copies) n=1 Tax=Candidatus Kentrum eta TaxID=2126337 RepID=A0A450UY43_9GAMM|nr:MAG: Leucine Rich repeats (2 copies) [Candidatus Kentron sp. H]VFJ91132.1 MAG: Leucine Rich repeats (2 copies) [Candidatus Kentron sp. H]VFJ97448.1 MAG: Leucine Rich repeats (2 copies) [Candidatus Kentron sp. H]
MVLRFPESEGREQTRHDRARGPEALVQGREALFHSSEELLHGLKGLLQDPKARFHYSKELLHGLKALCHDWKALVQDRDGLARGMEALARHRIGRDRVPIGQPMTRIGHRPGRAPGVGGRRRPHRGGCVPVPTGTGLFRKTFIRWEVGTGGDAGAPGADWAYFPVGGGIYPVLSYRIRSCERWFFMPPWRAALPAALRYRVSSIGNRSAALQGGITNPPRAKRGSFRRAGRKAGMTNSRTRSARAFGKYAGWRRCGCLVSGRYSDINPNVAPSDRSLFVYTYGKNLGFPYVNGMTWSGWAVRNEAYNRAEEKIRAALNSGARALDLSQRWDAKEDKKLTELPPSLAELTRLQELSFRHNQLTTLPAFLSKLIRLRHLYLGDNRPTVLAEWLN